MTAEKIAPVRRLAELRLMTGLWFFVVAFAARVPVAMNVVGVLTLMTVVRGDVAEASLVSAALGLASGIGGPLIGSIADRAGQRRIVLVVGFVHAVLLIGLLAAVYAELSFGALLVMGAFVGATIPPVSPLTRARWLSMLEADTRAGGKGVSVSLGYESMADEISFVGGPVLVGVLATAFGPAVPLIASAAIVVVFVTAFALHPTAELVHPAHRAADEQVAPRRALVSARVLLPVAGMVAMGMFFGSTLATLTAFMDEAGSGEATGLIYGIMGATSAVAAILVGRLPEKFRQGARWAVGAAAMLAAGVVISAVPSLGTIVVVYAVVGVAVGGTLVTLFTIGADAAPAGRLATMMTMLSSAIIIGQGVTVAAVGAYAEAHGAAASFPAIAIAGATGLVCAVGFMLVARRRRG